eukprot:Gregarina_sp_Poly_1__7014@NODE_3820_length_869_cov_881_402743_g2460_i0_p1_GENE_NODE_3820_length_869_cov_881_402743_g2460_i0NODE_3820_length_869_cov_881_402743_g2460_i0_p1_ORF_typecomplete_len208_score34_37ADK/PF00406_22/5_8e46AAA_17/PF13207_6/7_3e28AAA_18/PF13238_6/7_8e11Zeta_toxin/PF06414_12/8_4e09AAA_33/PF13671_6/3_1e07Thymidylate_kin/PF02223_17/0_057Thymidylate_kin/PF02223_17/0_17PRK/PF00485_18/0_039CoaE/PF01121_20/0_035CoaE/PF01121_20/27CPT/PF07931_12/0_01Cytidylate_kin/PF02224_18/0_053_NODE
MATSTASNSPAGYDTNKPSVVFVLGGPGAGKGTQCERIQKYCGFHHISAGDCLREERERPGSRYGEEIEKHIKNGTIVPVEITCALLLQKMRQIQWEGGKFLIDGFPRNRDNLDGWLKASKGDVDILFCLVLEVPNDVRLERLLKRGEHSGRIDDNIESIKKRFVTFEEQTKPIIQQFEAWDKCKRVPGDKSVDEVWAGVEECFRQC